MNWSFQRLRREEREFLGVLTDSRNARCSAPIEVHVRELVRQNLQFVLVELAAVVDDVVGGWRDCSLTNVLRDQEETEKTRKVKMNFKEISKFSYSFRSGKVISESTTVPGFGLAIVAATFLNKRVLVRLLTMM